MRTPISAHLPPASRSGNSDVRRGDMSAPGHVGQPQAAAAGPTRSKTCSVCGLDTNSYNLNYGASTCLGCRAFFRRVVQRKIKSELKCRGDAEGGGGLGSCSVTLETRKRCKKCRFDACLRAGMRPDLVMTGEQYNKHFRKMIKKKQSGETAGNVGAGRGVAVGVSGGIVAGVGVVRREDEAGMGSSCSRQHQQQQQQPQQQPGSLEVEEGLRMGDLDFFLENLGEISPPDEEDGSTAASSPATAAASDHQNPFPWSSARRASASLTLPSAPDPVLLLQQPMEDLQEAAAFARRRWMSHPSQLETR